MGERDVVVIGGGPAGLATAIHAARHGLTVTVCDSRRPPIDKACGEGILGAGVASLERLGPRAASLGRRIAGIRYLASGATAEARFPPDRAGLGVRRTRLHAALVAAAAAAGVELEWGCRVSGLSKRGVRTGGGELAARFVVGADGLQSQVRHWAGLAGAPARRRRFGLRRHFQVAPWTDHVEVHWAPGCEAYVTPVGDDQVGVAFLWSTRLGGFEEFLSRVPTLASRLAGAPAASEERGSGPFEQQVRGATAGRVALVGDAAGYVDAITGEGLGIAFLEAEALGSALAAGDLAAYARASRRIRRRPERLARLLLTVDASPPLRRSLVPFLAAWPRVFVRLLGLLAAPPPARVAAELVSAARGGARSPAHTTETSSAATVASAPSSRSDRERDAVDAAVDRGTP